MTNTKYTSFLKLIQQHFQTSSHEFRFLRVNASFFMCYRHSLDWFSSWELCMWTMTGLRWYWSLIRLLSQSHIISGLHSVMRSGSRLKCSSRTLSWLTMARRTSECNTYCAKLFFCNLLVLDMKISECWRGGVSELWWDQYLLLLNELMTKVFPHCELSWPP